MPRNILMPVDKIRVYPHTNAKDLAHGLDVIIEPYREGIAWHFGLPSVCTHEDVAWDNDFYACEDRGQCKNCKDYLYRQIRNEGRDGLGFQYEKSERMDVPPSRYELKK